MSLQKTARESASEQFYRIVRPFWLWPHRLVCVSSRWPHRVCCLNHCSPFPAYQIIGFIHHHSQSFGTLKWKDPMQARSLLNKGLQIIQNNPTAEELLPIVRAVIDLLDIPENEKPTIGSLICLHLARNNA